MSDSDRELIDSLSGDCAETGECDYCGEEVEPFNPRATAHVCRECLKDIQVGDRT